jgi:hypothetical protein
MEDDEEAQKRGVVACAYCVDGALNLDPQTLRKIGILRTALPLRLDSVHVCYNDPLKLPFISLAMFIMGAHTRVRFRAHYGSDEECQCQLSSFGIQIHALPVSPRGEFNLENHRMFLARDRAITATKSKGTRPLSVAQKVKKKPKEKEKATSRQPITKDNVFMAAAPQPNLNEPTSGYAGGLLGFNNVGFLPSFPNPWWMSVVGAPNLPSAVSSLHQGQLPLPPQSHITGPTRASVIVPPPKPYVIIDPLPNDILFGRGIPIQERPGNVRFREMLGKNMHKYDQVKKGAKTLAVTYIIHTVKEEGGRFLKEWKGEGWVEVNEATARAKVSHAFRGRREVFHATLKKDESTA